MDAIQSFSGSAMPLPIENMILTKLFRRVI